MAWEGALACARFASTLLLLYWPATLVSVVEADTRVGTGACTWGGSTSFAGSTATYTLSAAVDDTVGECRGHCEEAHSERLVGYALATPTCTCYLAGATGPSAALSPDGTSGITGTCYATRPTARVGNERLALEPLGSVPAATAAEVSTYLRATAFKTWSAAERGLGAATRCTMVDTALHRSVDEHESQWFALTQACLDGWIAMGGVVVGPGVSETIYVIRATHIDAHGAHHEGVVQLTTDSA